MCRHKVNLEGRSHTLYLCCVYTKCSLVTVELLMVLHCGFRLDPQPWKGAASAADCTMEYVQFVFDCV